MCFRSYGSLPQSTCPLVFIMTTNDLNTEYELLSARLSQAGRTSKRAVILFAYDLLNEWYALKKQTARDEYEDTQGNPEEMAIPEAVFKTK